MKATVTSGRAAVLRLPVPQPARLPKRTELALGGAA